VARAGPRKIARYGDRFKATAVKLSSLPGVLIKDVAAMSDVGHPGCIEASDYGPQAYR
jgi:transposase-like protein